MRAAPRSARGGERRHVDMLERGDAALRHRVERAERIDLVAVELDADGSVPVGREEIDDAAAARERSGHVDGVGRRPAACGEPVGELLRIETASHLQPTRAGRHVARIGERGEQGLDARDDHRRRILARQPLHEREPLGLHGIGRRGPSHEHAVRVVGGRRLGEREVLERGQEHRGRRREQGEVVEKGVRLGGVRQDDDERTSAARGLPRGDGGRVRPAAGVAERAAQSGHGERACRTPGSADRAAMPLAERGDDVGEPRMGVERVGEAEQPRRVAVGRRRRCGGRG